ncbi:DUF21 domain-containing protein [Camellia lanceoleosa]|uniref:DUF21 domain-containing protein n=1 Tax=Camellia lanceoleosa TaxID=1840588 RepID=A0ACC0GWJ8_9ERIC|nr:DUF21 domain-containing protein [Camellia lanceoleosa]
MIMGMNDLRTEVLGICAGCRGAMTPIESTFSLDVNSKLDWYENRYMDEAKLKLFEQMIDDKMAETSSSNNF